MVVRHDDTRIADDGRMPLRRGAVPHYGTADCHQRLPLHGLPADDGQCLFSLRSLSRGAFVITEGEPVIGGLHGPEARHHHCDHCKSWLFTRWGDMVNLRATMLDDPGWFEPFLETWTREKLPWASTPAQHSFEEFPPMEAFGDLIAEYARHISQI